jgi:hypothetical protein
VAQGVSPEFKLQYHRKKKIEFQHQVGMVIAPIIPALLRLRQEDSKF